jgi:cardiolipin synthase
MKAITGIMTFVLLSGCATAGNTNGPAGPSVKSDYREAYEVYPGAATSGISTHLVRSHTTAIAVRPLSSTFSLGCRVWDQIWDTGRRLETRLFRFPVLSQAPVPDVCTAAKGMDLISWEAYLDRTYGQASSVSQLEFLVDGESFYTSFEDAIDGARHSIDLQTYLFDNDDVARTVADRLRRRSNEIDVRVMFDGLGTYLSHTAQADTLPQKCNLIENMPRYLCEDSNIQLRVIPNMWLSGNHVKSIIFDRETAFIGGMNVGREYRHEWHDMMIRLEGRAVGMLSQNFSDTWRRSGWGGDLALLVLEPAGTARQDVAKGDIPVRFLQTLPADAQIYRAQLEAIRRARAYIYIENCYFSDDRILYELCRARKRGVDVRVIMPEVVNHRIMERSNRIAVNTLLAHGARVYSYPGMSHVKAAVYDGWACVGTANFDKLSLQIIRELNLATSHPETVQALIDQLFIPDFEQSDELTDPLPLNFSDHLIELVADEV